MTLTRVLSCQIKAATTRACDPEEHFNVLTDIAAADPRELRAEVCVVGGGAAGITVATELARETVFLSSSSKGAGGDSRNARNSCSAQRWSASPTAASMLSGSGPSVAPLHAGRDRRCPFRTSTSPPGHGYPRAAGRSRPPSCSRT